ANLELSVFMVPGSPSAPRNDEKFECGLSAALFSGRAGELERVVRAMKLKYRVDRAPAPVGIADQ
ncbi:MAG TPA: hypothetical protein VE443_04020, partial [Beijerinckiaceae bacterium]|nr:hypothetical protein [Beijerinckiaceae bacterium]